MSKQASGQRQPVKQAQRRERREETRRREQAEVATKRKRKVIIAAVITCVVIVGAIIGIVALFNSTSSSTNTAGDTNQLAPPVGNIQCNQSEQLAFHHHAHLSIYINGQSVPLPAYIGITNTCYYWMHTHDATGIIHMEAPRQITLTLGTFLQLWREQFSQLQYQNQLSSTTGWQVYVNGKPYNGDFNQIKLQQHDLITLAYNSPNVKPETTFNWGSL